MTIYNKYASRHIYFDKETDERLERYLKQKYGDNARSRSLIVQLAVKEYLESQGA